MTTLRYSRRALRDIEEIRQYIEADNPDAAERVVLHLKKRISRLEIDPLAGVPANNPRFRILYPIKYPYRIYYEVARHHVAILHIRHTSRKLPKLRGFHED